MIRINVHASHPLNKTLLQRIKFFSVKQLLNLDFKFMTTWGHKGLVFSKELDEDSVIRKIRITASEEGQHHHFNIIGKHDIVWNDKNEIIHGLNTRLEYQFSIPESQK